MDYNSSSFRNGAIDRLNGKFGKDDENRGDRMVARGERMMVKADARLEKRLTSQAEKTSSKKDKLSNKYGEAPKLGQDNRLKSAKDKAGKAASNLRVYNNAKDYQKEYPNEASGNEQFKAGKKNSYFLTATPEKLKYEKGQTKVKKGEMLSKHINSKKQ